MPTSLKAIYENGVFKPQEPVHLEEHTEVEVPIPAPASSDADDPIVCDTEFTVDDSWLSAEPAVAGLTRTAFADDRNAVTPPALPGISPIDEIPGSHRIAQPL